MPVPEPTVSAPLDDGTAPSGLFFDEGRAGLPLVVRDPLLSATSDPRGSCSNLPMSARLGATSTTAGLFTEGEARALGSPVEAADTDVAAAEEEACGEARALGCPVEAADTDVTAAEEEACGEACALGCPVEAADTDVAAADADVAAAEDEACREACKLGEAVEAAFDDPET